MFDFRTKSLSAFIWLLAASQLLLQPAAETLHFNCGDNSHLAPAIPGAGGSGLLGNLQATWRWLIHPQCCDHSDSAKAAARQCNRAHREFDEAGCCHSSGAASPGDDHPAGSPAHQHDADQCPICCIIFAARITAQTVQSPAQNAPALETVAFAVPTTDADPRYELPSRGPPCA